MPADSAETTVRARCYLPDEPDAQSLQDDPKARLVHLIRHGEATHQLAAAAAKARGEVCRCDEENSAAGPGENRCPYLNDALIDPPLTEKGRRSVTLEAIECVADVVYVSPMRRSLETALRAFAPNLAAAAGLGASPRAVIQADELLRPRIGAHRQSRRSPRRVLEHQFPAVDFSRVADDEDRFWAPVTEPRAALDARARLFLRRILTGPERRIGIITHFTTLLTWLAPAADPWIIGTNPERPKKDRPYLDPSPRAAEVLVYQPIPPGGLRTFIAVPE